MSNTATETDRLANIEANLSAILNHLQTFIADANKMDGIKADLHDMTLKVDSAVAALSENTIKVGAMQSSLDRFTTWLTPLLNDFHDSQILPTMSLIDGKTQLLMDSHNEIKTLVSEAIGKVEPLITRLETSPLLKMLGVKDI